MQYLCLGYLEVNEFAKLSEDEQTALLKECFAQCVPFRATGKVKIEEGLSNSAKSIRPKNGKPVVTDGPFVDTKETIGAFWVIEADSLEDAIEVASLHPAALMGEEYGFGVEIREIRSYSGQ